MIAYEDGDGYGYGDGDADNDDTRSNSYELNLVDYHLNLNLNLNLILILTCGSMTMDDRRNAKFEAPSINPIAPRSTGVQFYSFIRC